MKKPIIGLFLEQMPAPKPGATHKVQYINQPYFRGVEAAGGVPLALPIMENLADLEPLFALCDGFLLPGGDDVDPQCYGETPHPTLGICCHHADLSWASCVHHAETTGKPVLGICRGLQLTNVALGGSLYQDMSLVEGAYLKHSQDAPRHCATHKVNVAPHSRLAEILGNTSVETNSMHHQCAHRLGRGLEAVAWAEDGGVEGLESQNGQFLLVQWHPEDLRSEDEAMHRLFMDLVERSLGSPSGGAVTEGD